MAGEAWRSDIPEEKGYSANWPGVVASVLICLFIGAGIWIILFPPHRATQSGPVIGAGASEIYEDEKVVVFKIQDGKCTIYIARRTYGSDGITMQLGEGCK